MAHRHSVQARARGGRTYYAGGGSNVAKEAAKRKDGGAAFKRGGFVPGKKAGKRVDKRARGGGVGSDKHPFSSAKLGK